MPAEESELHESGLLEGMRVYDQEGEDRERAVIIVLKDIPWSLYVDDKIIV